MSTSIKQPTNTNSVTANPSVPPSNTANSSAPPSAPVTTDSVNYRLPEKLTLENAVKWAMIEDRPIMMDYWADSLEKKVIIGVRENQEKLLVKSADEYTSPIVKIFKHNTDYIVMTENSIYLVDSSIAIKRIS